MTTPHILIIASCVAITAAAFLMSGKFRLGQIVRYFATQSFFLVLLLVGLGAIGSAHLYVSAGAVLIVKAIVIPMALMWSAQKSGVSGRLASVIRPAPSYFLAGIMLVLAAVGTQLLRPHMAELDMTTSVVMLSALSVMALGAAMLAVRRDLYSQIIGFLTLENGISMLGAATLGAVPLLLEGGVFVVVTLGAVLMSVLSSRLKELYAIEDTAELNELVD